MEAKAQIIGYIVVAAEVEGVFGEFFVLDRPLFIGIASAHIEAPFFTRSGDAHIVVVHPRTLKDLVLPIGIGLIVCIIKRGGTFVSQILVVERFEALGIGHCNAVFHRFKPYRRIEIHDSLSFFGFLGSNDNHPISPANPKDSKRRGVFEDFHRLDILRVEVVDIIGKEPIDNV